MTGVQTCALPIYNEHQSDSDLDSSDGHLLDIFTGNDETQNKTELYNQNAIASSINNILISLEENEEINVSKFLNEIKISFAGLSNSIIFEDVPNSTQYKISYITTVSTINSQSLLELSGQTEFESIIGTRFYKTKNILIIKKHIEKLLNNQQVISHIYKFINEVIQAIQEAAND